MGFDSFVQIDSAKVKTPRVTKPRAKREVNNIDERGCEFCPSNNQKGIVKFVRPMCDKPVLIFTQSPGPEENETGVALSGDSARWFWKEMKQVGLARSECDFLYAMKCFPADIEEGSYSTYMQMRSPTKKELHCCSLYTELGLARTTAKHIVVLGKVAAQALFGRSLPTTRIFWSEKYKAKIYLLDHPSFFKHSYGGTKDRLATFRGTLKLVADAVHGNTSVAEISDPFSYLRKQEYRLVLNAEQALEAKRILQFHAKKNKRISFDIESGEVDGKWTVLACGFSPKKGQAFIFVFQHPDVKKSDGIRVAEIAKQVLETPEIKKAAHYGCSDIDDLATHADINVTGFDHDTYFTEYFRSVNQKKYGLAEIAATRFTRFAGYKTIVCADMLAAATIPVPERIKHGTLDVQYAWITKNNQFDVTRLSLETLRLYNGADADLTKRIEVTNKKIAPQALIQLYIDLSILLRRMEPNGPLLDYNYNEKLSAIIPARAKRLLHSLWKIARCKFNPKSSDQVATVLYDKLKFKYPFKGKPNTRKGTLLLLSRKNSFPLKIIEYRKAKTSEGTYVVSYRKCADANNGRLRTKWNATGTRTGRLSSSGDKDKKTSKGVNLQNIHSDPLIQNMLVADARWRVFYSAACNLLKQYKALCAWLKEHEVWKAVKNNPHPAPKRSKQVQVESELLGEALEAWVRVNMPDLRTFLAADYGQVEVRVAAQLSGDKNLIKDCQESDIHTTVGVAMTGWDPEKIRHDKFTRTRTKNVHFGILFGQSEDGTVNYVYQMSPIEERDKISEKDIRRAYRKYQKRYPGVFKFRDFMRAFVREHKYVETLFGLRRYLNVDDDKNDSTTEVYEDEESGEGNAYWGNQAVNTPIQGTAHQLMICALVNLVRKVTRRKYKVLGIPTLEVHDALYFMPRVLDLVDAHGKLKYLLEQESLNTVKSDFPHIKWEVPIVTELEAGLRLGCKVELAGDFTVSSYLVAWFLKCREQVKLVNKEVALAVGLT